MGNCIERERGPRFRGRRGLWFHDKPTACIINATRIAFYRSPCTANVCIRILDRRWSSNTRESSLVTAFRSSSACQKPETRSFQNHVSAYVQGSTSSSKFRNCISQRSANYYSFYSDDNEDGVWSLSNDERNLSKGIAHWFFGLCVDVEKLESILWRIYMSVWYYDAVILLCDLDNDWSLVLLNLFWFSPRTSVICNKNARFESYYSFDSRNFLALFRIVIVSFVDLSYAQLILRTRKKVLVHHCSFCLSVWLMPDTNYLM